jgi:cytochrome c-type biogenesis protein CcmH
VRTVVALLLALGLAVPALAVTPQERLTNPELEGRAEEIGAQLRCLVCQNESIEESNADLAHDIRLLLRQRLTAGDTDQQAIQFIVARYGQFVLLRPPIEPATWALWYGPPALVVLALAGAGLWLRRRRVAPAAPLDAAERSRLCELLREAAPLSPSPTQPTADETGHDRRDLVAER